MIESNTTPPSHHAGDYNAVDTVSEVSSSVEELEKKGNALIVLSQEARNNHNETLADELLRQAQDLFAKAKASGADWVKVADEKTQHIRAEASQYTQANPLKAVGIAAAFGLLLGLLFKGKSRKA